MVMVCFSAMYEHERRLTSMLSPIRKTLLLLEALVCFAPLAFTLFFGVLIFPVWAGMLFVYWVGLVKPEPDDGPAMPWAVIWPMSLVICGVLGLFGLARILGILFSGNPNPRWRVLTMALVALGAFAVIVFNLFSIPNPIEAPIQFVVLLALPVIGIVHFTYLVRRVVLRPIIVAFTRTSRNDALERTRDE